MNILRTKILFAFAVLLLAGCSTTDGGKETGLFHTDSELTYLAPPVGKFEVRNGAVLRFLPFEDQRIQKNHHALGDLAARIYGLEGDTLKVDRDVAAIATDLYKNRFRKAGFAIEGDANAKQPVFELSAKVKTLTLNSKERDDISIGIETSLKEIATGKVFWTALVEQKRNRFAGVAGNSKSDLVDFLNSELMIVADKTVSAVDALLMAAYPSLFNLTPGTKTINGVTVFTAPVVTPRMDVPVVAPVVPVAPVASVPTPVVLTGSVSVTTQPAHAKVYIDDVYYGMSPMTIDVDAGVHTVEVKFAGRKSVKEKVAVRKGETTEWEASLGR